MGLRLRADTEPPASSVAGRRLPSLATRMIEPSRRHRPFVPRHRRSHHSALSAKLTSTAESTAVHAWEDEGGTVALITRVGEAEPLGITRKRPGAVEPETAEDDRFVVVDAPTALKGFLLALRLPHYRCRIKQ